MKIVASGDVDVCVRGVVLTATGAHGLSEAGGVVTVNGCKGSGVCGNMIVNNGVAGVVGGSFAVGRVFVNGREVRPGNDQCTTVHKTLTCRVHDITSINASVSARVDVHDGLVATPNSTLRVDGSSAGRVTLHTTTPLQGLAVDVSSAALFDGGGVNVLGDARLHASSAAGIGGVRCHGGGVAEASSAASVYAVQVGAKKLHKHSSSVGTVRVAKEASAPTPPPQARPAPAPAPQASRPAGQRPEAATSTSQARRLDAEACDPLDRRTQVRDRLKRCLRPEKAAAELGVTVDMLLDALGNIDTK